MECVLVSYDTQRKFGSRKKRGQMSRNEICSKCGEYLSSRVSSITGQHECRPKMIEYFITGDDAKICKYCYEELSTFKVHNCRKTTTINPINPTEERITKLEEEVHQLWIIINSLTGNNNSV
jgi:hypothetical protein